MSRVVEGERRGLEDLREVFFRTAFILEQVDQSLKLSKFTIYEELLQAVIFLLDQVFGVRKLVSL
jgi:hypothetical protein